MTSVRIVTAIASIRAPFPRFADTDDFESRQQPAQAVISQSVDDRG